MKDLFSVRGKVAIVTGGSIGIGTMIARGYLEAGARVYISARKEARLEAAATELSKLGTCTPFAADLSTEEGSGALAIAAARTEDEVHILVNNTGANWAESLEKFHDSAWGKVLDTNVKSVFHLRRSLLPQLEAAGWPGNPASVINIGSTDGLQVPVSDTFSYAASKAAVHHLTRVLAKQLPSQNITVNAVAPGPFESRMMAATLERFRDVLVTNCPLGRIGEPEDMADIAIYLASRAGAYLTGTVIPVDGGISTTH